MIAVTNLGLAQGAFKLEGITFAIPAGAYAVLMGRTGCGKTTLLEAIAGLRSIHAGVVHLHGHDVTRQPPAQRRIGYVPQDGALFQSMTVAENLAFALTLRNVAPARIDARVGELADWLGLQAILRRYPAALSGGEKQRVALGRALAFDPPVLLLDEPLSALDDDTRGQLVELLQTLRQRRAVTVLHVTHNRLEAALLGDQILRLEAGKLVDGGANPH